MKVVALLSRMLLGDIFVASGVSGVPPGHTPSFSTQLAKQYMAVIQATPYGHIGFAGQTLCGLLLIVDLFAPMPLIVLGAHLLYISCSTSSSSQAALTLLLGALWVFTFLRYRDLLSSLLEHRFIPKSEAR